MWKRFNFKGKDGQFVEKDKTNKLQCTVFSARILYPTKETQRT